MEDWLLGHEVRETNKMRLFCFPYAGGGGSAYLPWKPLLPEWISLAPIQLPGHETRIGEAPFSSFTDLAIYLANLLGECIELPFALYGHSMGASLAYAVAHLIKKKHNILPVHLFVSGASAPHIPTIPRKSELWSDDELIDKLVQLNGTPDLVLKDKELCKLFLPLIRADFSICDTFNYIDQGKLDCPITSFFGSEDTEVSICSGLEWNIHTSKEFKYCTFSGDHFFIKKYKKEIVEMISSDLRIDLGL